MNTRVAPETSQETEEQQKEETKTEQPGLAEKITSQIKELSQKISDTWESSSPQHKRIFLIVVVFLLALIIIVPTAVVVSTKSQKSGTGNKTSNDSLPISGKQTGNQDSFKLCNPNPCENQGVCVSGYYDYACKCQDGYYGNKCNIRIDLCDSNPCENNGTCVSENNDYACKCQDGYYGKKCDIRNNLCDSNPCENNGTCLSENNDYACNCKDGYYGSNCEILNNLCDSNPCMNGGTCLSGNNDYACNCKDGYYGQNCQKIFNACESIPCKNNGTCVDKDMDYGCKCLDGYYGENCNKSISPLHFTINPDWYPSGWRTAAENAYQYYVLTKDQDWSNSRAECQALGGDLAINGMKRLQTRQYIGRIMKLNDTYWIGLVNVNNTGFAWADGSQLISSDAHWASGQPSSANEDCVTISDSADFVSNDRNCSMTYKALCEKKIF